MIPEPTLLLIPDAEGQMLALAYKVIYSLIPWYLQDPLPSPIIFDLLAVYFPRKKLLVVSYSWQMQTGDAGPGGFSTKVLECSSSLT